MSYLQELAINERLVVLFDAINRWADWEWRRHCARLFGRRWEQEWQKRNSPSS